MSEGNSTRHAACVECRQRKVRCDGGQPNCQNCSRRGSECVYVRNSGQDKQEMMEMIRNLTKRLSRAEESLETRRYPVAPSTGPSSGHSPDAFWTESSTSVPTAQLSFDFPGDVNELMSLDTNWALFPDSQWTGTDLHSLDSATDDSFSPIVSAHGSSSISPQEIEMIQDEVDKSVEDPAPPHVLDELYIKYFEKAHNEYFMMRKDRFLSRIHDPLAGLETESLRLIVLAHGASISLPYAHLARRFYELSRKCFEQAELGKGFLTIAALQSCILLALFELKQALFTRAWTSVSRAYWMVQMFGLQKMDGDPVSPLQKKECRHLLPPAIDTCEIEERRRTFWSAFNLSCFASIGVGWKTYIPVNYADITTLLPSDEISDSPSRLTLSNAFRLSGFGNLTVSQALISINALCGRCLTHISHATAEGGLYDFWMHHCHLIESATHMASTALSTSHHSQNDTSILCFNISLQAILVCLHNAGAVRLASTNAPQPSNAYSEISCQKTAVEIARLTRIMMGCVDLANISPFVPWSIYVAAQACIRALHSESIKNQSPRMSMSPSRSSSSSSTLDFWALPSGTTEGISTAHVNGLLKGPMIDYAAISEPPASRLTLIDALKCLMDALGSSKHYSPVSGIFEAELRGELTSGKSATDDRLIGFVNFPLDGQHLL